MKPKPYRRSRGPGNVLVKAFVWVVLGIFVLTSVGVALVVVTPH
ncbi:MAG TPA: hypothetical protein VHT05_10495 [Candidatus Elarobacter sp.]|jgi:hypothetical protein|nr:hypothetical protein [Candidatus Elarobacter sp.]